MDHDRPMYRWRQMTPAQRREALEFRQRNSRPWHGPPHFVGDTDHYLITAACYEHKPFIGKNPQRMADFERQLLADLEANCEDVFAWVVLPNHYHVLVIALNIDRVLSVLGKLHGRTSFQWNGEDDHRGYHVWHRAAETAMKSERHFWATMNYVLHNAVKHGYVDQWQDWPYLNADQYLAELGRGEAERRWREYPIDDYGKDWDPPDL